MFIAHTNDILSDSYNLLDFSRDRVLVSSDGYYLLSNICPHQGSYISNSSGKGSRICPYHGWSFDIQGNPLGSGTTKRYCKNNEKLEKTDLSVWKNLIFTEKINPEPLEFLDFQDYQLVEKRIDSVDADSKVIMDVFLDVDHIPIVHSGVYDQIGIKNVDNVDWHFFDYGSLQLVDDSQGKKTAAWLAVYPNTMIEWQNGSLFITVALENKSVIVYKYRDKNSTDDLWKLNESIWETAWEQDKEQSSLIKKLADKNLEESKIHFRNWLSKNS